MRVIPMLLLNLATVAVALVVYDQVRSDPTPAPSVGGATLDTGSIERRLEALEGAGRPTLQTAGTDPGVLERLAVLEASARMPSSDDPGTSEPAPDTPALRGRMSVPDPSVEPTEDDVRWFRKLQRAAKRADWIEKNRTRVDKALAKLSLRLTSKQREEISAAFTDFQPRVKEIWTEAKSGAQDTIAAGGQVDRREIVETTTAVIQQEFAKTLTDVVSTADAEAVAAALMPGGR